MAHVLHLNGRNWTGSIPLSLMSLYFADLQVFDVFSAVLAFWHSIVKLFVTFYLAFFLAFGSRRAPQRPALTPVQKEDGSDGSE